MIKTMDKRKLEVDNSIRDIRKDMIRTGGGGKAMGGNSTGPKSNNQRS